MVPELSTDEQQLISVTWRVARDGKVPDKAHIDLLARERLGVVLDWDCAYSRLLQEKLIRRDGDLLFLTVEGQACRERAEREYPFIGHMYDTFYSRAAASRAHATFCEQVYGKNLCQHGLADMVQLETLIESLRVHRGQHVLDLGCGNGMITEYISDVTEAKTTGIDVSRVGIQQALERTQHKRQRVAFEVGNLKALGLPDNAFDVVLLIDSIYFLDRELIVQRAKAALKPGGQIGIFYSQWGDKGDPCDLVQPEDTDLAELLHRCGLCSETWDFSAAEDAHWQLKLDTLATLRPRFEAEGNSWLHSFRQREAARSVTRRSYQNRSRHLFRVWHGET